jgi:hypothetical protein
MVDYKILAARLGPKIIEGVAERIWEAFINSAPYEHRAAGLSAEDHRFRAFSIDTGLPADTARRYMKVCREFEREFVHRSANRRKAAPGGYRVQDSVISEEAIREKYAENDQAPLGQRLPNNLGDLIT